MGWTDIRDGNPVKDKLGAGGTTIGAFIRTSSIEIVEISAHAGCEFLIIDTEHSPVGWERVQAMIIAAEAAGAVPILRVPNWTRDLISRGLDAGAHGIMIPQVETAAAAAEAVAATRYGPHGTRGTAGNRRATYGLRMPLSAYTEAANRTTLVVIQIESVAGVANAMEIAAVDGIDVILVGLADLSVDLGLDGAWHHQTVLDEVQKIIDACHANGVAFGIPATDAEMSADYIRKGTRFIAVGDIPVYAKALKGFLEEVHSSGV